MHAPALLALRGARALLALRDEGSTPDTNGSGEGILLAGIVEEDKSLFLGIKGRCGLRRHGALFTSWFDGDGRLGGPAEVPAGTPAGVAPGQPAAALVGTLTTLGTSGSCLIVTGEVSGMSMTNKPVKYLWSCAMHTAASRRCVKSKSDGGRPDSITLTLWKEVVNLKMQSIAASK